jgi:predicted RNA-binding protein YlxR (DUF448 family)
MTTKQHAEPEKVSKGGHATKERTCIICGKTAPKGELLRWIASNGTVSPDWTQKLGGRSVYTCFSSRCLSGIYSKRFNPAFCDNFAGFGIDKSQIFDFVKENAQRSRDWYFNICLKSGVLVKGQNLIAESARAGTVFSRLFFAEDAAENTVSSTERALGLTGIRLDLKKEELGGLFDGREVSVFALKPSEQSEKLVFYMYLSGFFTHQEK